MGNINQCFLPYTNATVVCNGNPNNLYESWILGPGIAFGVGGVLFLVILISDALCNCNEVFKRYMTISAFSASPKRKSHRYLLIFLTVTAVCLAWTLCEERQSRILCKLSVNEYLFRSEIAACILLPFIGIFYTKGEKLRINGEPNCCCSSECCKTYDWDEVKHFECSCCDPSKISDEDRWNAYPEVVVTSSCSCTSICFSEYIHLLSCVAISLIFLICNGIYLVEVCCNRIHCAAFGQTTFILWIASIVVLAIFLIVWIPGRCKMSCNGRISSRTAISSFVLELIFLVLVVVTTFLCSLRRNHFLDTGV